MSSLTLELPRSRVVWPAWREHGLAFGVALGLHVGLAYVLFNLSQQAPLPMPVSTVLTTQLITLPAPVVEPPAPVPVEPPAPLPEPVVEAPPIEQADLAFKRVEQERQEQEHKRERERQQRREEAQRQERLAREERAREEQARQAQLEAQARQAEAERQAAQAAAARAKAEAEAASRQYLPIAKEAPDYPAKALARKIEGECTVAYTVNAAGRVENPKVVGDCHPLFVKPSLAAAKAFRYQPRLVNGQAVAVANVKNTFSYKIQ